MLLAQCCAASVFVRAQTPALEEQAATIRSRAVRVDIATVESGCEVGADNADTCEFPILLKQPGNN